MKCSYLDLGNGQRAIVCGSRRYKVETCACGKPATRLCDWILVEPQVPLFAIDVTTIKTCDIAICSSCTSSPAPGKDLCPLHAAQWANDPRNKG